MKYAVASQDGTVKVWDVRSHQPLETFVSLESTERNRRTRKRDRETRYSISSMSSIAHPIPSSPTSLASAAARRRLFAAGMARPPPGLEVRSEDGAQFLTPEALHSNTPTYAEPLPAELLGGFGWDRVPEDRSVISAMRSVKFVRAGGPRAKEVLIFAEVGH